jgi:hypothetical protein
LILLFAPVPNSEIDCWKLAPVLDRQCALTNTFGLENLKWLENVGHSTLLPTLVSGLFTQYDINYQMTLCSHNMFSHVLQVASFLFVAVSWPVSQLIASVNLAIYGVFYS